LSDHDLDASSSEWIDLLQAADFTVAAAAIGLLWAGEDRFGVLARVAAASPTRMASTRFGPHALNDWPAPLTADEEVEVGRTESRELAALPSSVAPNWAQAVGDAIREAVALQKLATEFDADSSSWAQPPSWVETTQTRALAVIWMWTLDPVPTEEIRIAASVVLQEWALPIAQLRRPGDGSVEPD
jgi:hypothetical protein